MFTAAAISGKNPSCPVSVIFLMCTVWVVKGFNIAIQPLGGFESNCSTYKRVTFVTVFNKYCGFPLVARMWGSGQS